MNSSDLVLKNPFTGSLVRPPLRYIEDMIKKANVTLNKDRNSWNDEIISAFNNQHTDISPSGSVPHLEHRHKDWVEGCSVGAITATVGTDILLFPVIIRYGTLAPFDVVHSFKDGGWHHATDNYISSKVRRKSVFQGATPLPTELKSDEYDDSDRWSNISGMRENVTHETFNLRDACLTTPEVADKVAAIKTAALHEEARMAYTDDWVRRCIDEVGSIVAGSMKTKTAADAIIPAMDYTFFDVAFVKKAALDEYHVKLGRSGCNPVMSFKTSSVGIRELFEKFGSKIAEKILGDLDEHPEGITRHIGEAGLDATLGMDPNNFAMGQPVHAYGTYNVMLKGTGEPAIGLVIPVFDWDGEDSKSALFLNRDGWSIQKNMHGRRAAHDILPPEGRIEPEREGIFVYHSKGRAICTPPLRIKTMYTCKAGTQIKAVDLGQLTKINIIVSSDAQGIIPFGPELEEFAGSYDPSARNVIIPSMMVFTPLPETLVKVATKDEQINMLHVKLAQESFGGRGEGWQVGGRYEVVIPSVEWLPLPAEFNEKIAEDSRISVEAPKTGYITGRFPEIGFYMKVAAIPYTQQLLEIMAKTPSTKVQFATVRTEKLASLRAGSLRNVSTMVKNRNKALTKKACEVIRDGLPADSLVKLATAIPYIIKQSGDIFTALQECAKPVISHSKLASFGEGDIDRDQEQSLNTLFNLGLLNDRNLKYFNDKRDLLDDAENFFCKLLITTRLTAMPIEEEALENALEAITQARDAIISLGYGL
ncbi:MAG: hypothetical protein WC455_09830 [Dehalococcoidia bacterium]|jgi:hypothetical protein